MNDKKLPFYIAGGAVLIALVFMVSALAASNARKAAENEVYNLREQIARMKPYVPDLDLDVTPLPETRSGDTNSNNAAELRALLAEKEAQLQELQSRSDSGRGNNNRAPRESWEDRIARMKKEEPEEYADMIKRREEMQQNVRYNLAERTATFMDLDTSNMTEEERANHELLVEKMARVWELTDQFQDPEASPDREAMREMYTEMRDVRPLLDAERAIMFKQLGTDLGYQGDDAEAFAAHVEDIIGATSMRMPFGRGGGDSRGGRGGGDRGGDQGGRSNE